MRRIPSLSNSLVRITLLSWLADALCGSDHLRLSWDKAGTWRHRVHLQVSPKKVLSSRLHVLWPFPPHSCVPVIYHQYCHLEDKTLSLAWLRSGAVWAMSLASVSVSCHTCPTCMCWRHLVWTISGHARVTLRWPPVSHVMGHPHPPRKSPLVAFQIQTMQSTPTLLLHWRGLTLLSLCACSNHPRVRSKAAGGHPCPLEPTAVIHTHEP